MCGIAGIFNRNGESVGAEQIQDMITQIAYRGPDESGIYLGPGIGMGSVRLSIIDLATGQQPMSAAEESLWIVYNGEVFNYIELREELKVLGHSFRTTSDTEVLLKLYLQYGAACLEKLNGQFAFAIWDTRKRELFLARDRLGIRPLYYLQQEGRLIFASEIKCILESGSYQPVLDTGSLNELFTFWTIPTPGTLLEGIRELPPGHYMKTGPAGTSLHAYWELTFATGNTGEQVNSGNAHPAQEEELEALLTDAVTLRLRSDVPVAAYLSGGLDSSTTTYLIKKVKPGLLRTFSIGFEEDEFDETSYQEQVSAALETDHRAEICRNSDIAEHLERVVWHTEIPLFRTGAVPMYLLSRNVHRNDIKVVMTGEGADEFLGGYNIFKEALVREFWSRDPKSAIRPLLLQKLYPYLAQFKGRSNTLKFFFGHRLTDTASPLYSHLVRWNNAGHLKNYLDPEFIDTAQMPDPVEAFAGSLPGGFGQWDLLSRAQWIETKLFLSGYLLSSQGDRVSMANSVEGRYPFLDHRVVEFCNGLPPRQKITGLNEKILLKKAMKDKLPPQVVRRPKQAYRAPMATSLLSDRAPAVLKELLTTATVRDTGIFRPAMVEKLIEKLSGNPQPTEMENMALTGILTTHLFVDQYIRGRQACRIARPPTESRVLSDPVLNQKTKHR